MKTIARILAFAAVASLPVVAFADDAKHAPKADKVAPKGEDKVAAPKAEDKKADKADKADSKVEAPKAEAPKAK